MIRLLLVIGGQFFVPDAHAGLMDYILSKISGNTNLDVGLEHVQELVDSFSSDNPTSLFDSNYSDAEVLLALRAGIHVEESLFEFCAQKLNDPDEKKKKRAFKILGEIFSKNVLGEKIAWTKLKFNRETIAWASRNFDVLFQKGTHRVNANNSLLFSLIISKDEKGERPELLTAIKKGALDSQSFFTALYLSEMRFTEVPQSELDLMKKVFAENYRHKRLFEKLSTQVNVDVLDETLKSAVKDLDSQSINELLNLNIEDLVKNYSSERGSHILELLTSSERSLESLQIKWLANFAELEIEDKKKIKPLLKQLILHTSDTPAINATEFAFAQSIDSSDIGFFEKLLNSKNPMHVESAIRIAGFIESNPDEKTRKEFKAKLAPIIQEKARAKLISERSGFSFTSLIANAYVAMGLETPQQVKEFIEISLNLNQPTSESPFSVGFEARYHVGSEAAKTLFGDLVDRYSTLTQSEKKPYFFFKFTC
ncbi:MAG: hypothetical protein R3A80_11105 [Bdellovibrionota bacterium]